MVERELERIAHVVADHGGRAAERRDKADLDGIPRQRGTCQHERHRAREPKCFFHVRLPSLIIQTDPVKSADPLQAARPTPFAIRLDRCCARNLRLPASTNRGLRLRTFGLMQGLMHHNSHELTMARIIIPLGARRPAAKSLAGFRWRCRALSSVPRILQRCRDSTKHLAPAVRRHVRSGIQPRR
jgi:hypothetical protein